jgi:hypothetical protein
VDEVTWAALTTVLTAIGAAWTWYAFRNRGLASGLRGAGLTLLPPAAFLTGTLEMFSEIGGSVLDWATSVVLSPMVWAGIVLTGVAVLLLGSSAYLRERGRGGASGVEPKQAGTGSDRAALPPSSGRGEPAIDDDLADIEAILKRRGIT